MMAKASAPRPLAVGSQTVRAAAVATAASMALPPFCRMERPAAAAGALLVFCLLYTPCVAAIASVKRELGGKWALRMALLQCIVAWIAAFLTFMLFKMM